MPRVFPQVDPMQTPPPEWPPEYAAVTALGRQTERSHVPTSEEDRAAPPPMVGMLLHMINTLILCPMSVRTSADAEQWNRRPSWIQGSSLVVLKSKYTCTTFSQLIDDFSSVLTDRFK
jgi:hypothetical protein